MSVDFEALAKENIITHRPIDIEDLGDSPFHFEAETFTELKSAENSKFPLINLSFLSQRNKNGNPKFAVFTIDHKTCFFKVTATFKRRDEDAVEIESNISNGYVLDLYKDVFYSLLLKCKQSFFNNYGDLYSSIICENSISSQFTGLVPEKNRKEMY